ncbi:MAG: PpiC-type peptidyl-prolyl cis-trans isomerase [Ignavibacteria bacterium]|nr:MAG: PpiC-type peptidyl-prolyl cis-trans isomerase [Ignavibacteria bacterium]KAF0161283.1 MAG: PpiC-type peptidyl-prolyl cis-trans isomerase [Ignavibacteria bacterium]
MIKQYKTVFTLICILTLLNNQVFQSQQLALPKNVIAEVGPTKIYTSDFLTRYSDYIFASGIKDNIVTRRAILNNLINETLLLQYDDNKSIFDNIEYKKELKWAEKQTVLAFLKDRDIYAKMKVSEAELRDAFYKTNLKISARHLHAETEEEANSLYQLLQTGEDFYTLAKQVFTDSTLQNNGGYLGFFSWGDMDPAFEDAAYSLNPGEISKPIKTKFGYSIIKVEERVPNPLLTETEFIKNKRHIERTVRMRNRSVAEADFVKKYFNPHNVIVDKKILSKTLENLTYSTVNLVELNTRDFLPGVFVKYQRKNYLQKDILNRINEMPFFHREKVDTEKNFEAVIKGFVLQDILLGLAVKKGYNKADEVQKTIKKYNNNIFLKYKRAQVAETKIFNLNEVEKFYNDNPIYFKSEDQINVQEIIVSRKTLADSLIGRIKSGSDFGDLAAKYSLRTWSAKNKGEMGFSEISKFGGLKDTLANAEIGNIIGPLKIQEMFGIFKLLGKKEGGIKSFDEVKELAEKLLRKEKSKPIMEEYITGLRKKTIVKWNDELLGSLTID